MFECATGKFPSEKHSNILIYYNEFDYLGGYQNSIYPNFVRYGNFRLQRFRN